MSITQTQPAQTSTNQSEQPQDRIKAQEEPSGTAQAPELSAHQPDNRRIRRGDEKVGDNIEFKTKDAGAEVMAKKNRQSKGTDAQGL